ncbi:MAG: ABC transporter permease [Planctomycetes bacterium]|nr:ABC transporter permease [Planctomycetota bacterium]
MPSPLSGAARRCWTIARLTFQEGTRSRLTAVLVGVMVAAILLIPLRYGSLTSVKSVLDGKFPDKSPAAQVQTVLEYTLGTISMTLSLLTVLLTCGVVCHDIERRSLFTTMAKPVARWQYILGRWVGVCLIQAALIGLCGLALYGTVRALRYPYASAAASLQKELPASLVARAVEMRFNRLALADELAGLSASQQAAYDRWESVRFRLDRLDHTVLSSRARCRPADIDERLATLAQQREQELRRSGQYDLQVREHGEPQVAAGILEYAKGQLEDAENGERLTWRFEDLPKPGDLRAGESVQFRIRLSASNAIALEGLQRDVEVLNPATGEAEPLRMLAPVDAPATVDIPVSMITPDGTLDITFINEPPRDPAGSVERIESGVHISLHEVYLLYRVGRFVPNFARGLAMMWLLQAFLAAIAMMASSWLSFPIACLWCVVLYLMGMMARFFASDAMARTEGALTNLGEMVLRGMAAVIPSFELINPAPPLVAGVEIPWDHLLTTAGIFIVLWGGVALAIAAVIFTRRELARLVA